MPCTYYDEPVTRHRYRDAKKQTIYDAAYQVELDKLRASFTDEEKQAERQLAALKEQLDEVTHDGCVIREAFLATVDEQGLVSAFITRTRKAQVEHRKMDLARLTETLNGKIERARKIDKLRDYQAKLWLVEHASPHIPLEDQLGFDPDSM